MIQRKIFWFGVLAFVFLMSLMASAQRVEKIQTIVIDAGHGGWDSGVMGKTSMEKSLNLAVALKLGNYVKENLPGVKVIYTRDADEFVELSERTAIANRNNADVFISIHCNSSDDTTRAVGAETYVLGESKNEISLNVAKKENAAILLEDSTEVYHNFDPNSTEAYAVFSLAQSLYQEQSLLLAEKVQKHFSDKLEQQNGGVQQAGFLVLKEASMPSVLVELGNINHEEEEQFLNSDKGQTLMALALFQGLVEFKRECEGDDQQTLGQLEEKSDSIVEQPVSDTVKKEIFFSVQFASSKTKMSLKNPSLKNIKGVRRYRSKGMYCYSSGKFFTKAAAEKRQRELKKKGYEKAFIVAFIDKKQVSVKHAEAELRKMKQ